MSKKTLLSIQIKRMTNIILFFFVIYIYIEREREREREVPSKNKIEMKVIKNPQLIKKKKNQNKKLRNKCNYLIKTLKKESYLTQVSELKDVGK